MKKSISNKVTAKLVNILRNTDMDVYDKFMLEMNAIGILTVKGCKEISEFNDERIIVLCEDKYINIEGNNLRLSRYSSSLTEITGKIRSISFI